MNVFLVAFLHVVIQGPRLVSSHGSAIPFGDLCIQEQGEREEMAHPLLNCLGPEVTHTTSAHFLLVSTHRAA